MQEHPMKAVVYGRDGSPDVLELTGIDQAVVGDDQVLIRVRVAQPSDGHEASWRAGHVNSQWRTVQEEEQQNEELLRLSNQILELTRAIHAMRAAQAPTGPTHPDGT
jgi:hypothetical protein